MKSFVMLTNSTKQMVATVLAAASAIAIGLSCAAAQSFPEHLREQGLVVGYADYAPDHYTDDNGKPEGWVIEVLNEVGGILGVPVQFSLVGSFQSLLPGVNAKKYGMAVGAFSITEERKKQYDFVSYYNSGNSILIRAGKPLVTVDEMCGKKAAISLGSYFATIVENFSATCANNGKPAIELMTFPTQEAVLIALDSGRSDFSIATISASSYLSKETNGRYVISGEPFFRTTAGFAFDKTEKGVRDAVASALQTMVVSGRYKEILTRWGVEAGALENAAVNP